MAGVTRLELATSCVTGRRSNRLSYTPDKGRRKLPEVFCRSSELGKKMIRTTDVKEVGVGNTAEETCRCPNQLGMVCLWPGYVNPQILTRPNSSVQAPFRLNSFKTLNKMAEREGFEPPLPFQVITLSRRAPSTAQPPLQQAGAYCVKSFANRQVN